LEVDRFRIVPALVALSLMAAASPARANHIRGATYNGTFSGGTMTFTVTPDGSGMSSFGFHGDYGNPCTGFAVNYTHDYVIPIPIFTQGSGHYFQDTTTGVAPTGAFPAPKTARGTFQFSSSCRSVPWTATTTASLPGSSPPRLPSPGNTGPTTLLWGKTTQRAQSSITVGVFCPSEACTATPGGTVNVPGSSRVYLLKGASTNVPKGGKARLKLKVPRSVQRAIKRALRRKKKIRAKVTVTARDAAGNNTTRKLTIRLKR
jgi:hypothetical protein